MTALIVRFDAPLMSFGGPSIDQRGVTQTFPALSMLAGLVANALGWDHRDVDRLEALQGRIRYAARIDRAGEALRDYQTVDLSKTWMVPEMVGWTTRGHLATRGGASGDMTHQRYRQYRADSVCTTAFTLVGEDAPSPEDIAAALREPARPLFIGRKCCLPAAPLLVAVVQAPSLVGLLSTWPRAARADDGPLPASWWDGDAESGAEGTATIVPVTDERDWTNRVHVGRRFMREGRVNPPRENNA